MMNQTFAIKASDVTGQRQVNVSDISIDATVGELLDGLLPRMQLPRTDTTGQPLSYDVRLEREGRRLNRAERIGDSLQQDDLVVLQPNVDAGGEEEPRS